MPSSMKNLVEKANLGDVCELNITNIETPLPLRAVREAIQGRKLNIGPGNPGAISLRGIGPGTGGNIRVTTQVKGSIKGTGL